MKKFGGAIATCICIVLLITLVCPSIVQAYFNRGTVQLSLATTAVDMKIGETYNITVSMTPPSYTGLPGCGLAQCPHYCLDSCEGHMNDNNGQCQCGGDKPKTANASLSVSVANTAIASATYSSGVLSVRGIRAGQTSITVQGTLWEHTSSTPQVIIVNVSKASSGGGGDTGGGTEPTSGSGTVDTVTPGGSSGGTSGTGGSSSQNTVKPDGSTTNTGEETSGGEEVSSADGEQQSTEETESAENEVRTVETPKYGKVEIITLKNSATTGKAQMEKAKEEGSAVTLQKLDSGQKVLYSWTFLGKDIKTPADIDFGIELLKEPPILKSETGKLINPLYLSFAHEGELPGKALVSVSVGDLYEDGETLSLYYLNPDEGTLDLVAKDLEVKGGYAEFEIEHCSDYALSSGITDKRAGSSSFGLFIALAVVLAAGAAAGIVVFIRKNRRTLEEE